MKNIDKLYKIIDGLNFEELKRVRDIIDTKLEVIGQNTYDEEKLYQSLATFMDENFEEIEKIVVMPHKFLTTISDITGLDEDEILVGDIFSINKSELDINKNYVGEKILKSIDTALSKYGMDINYKLTSEQIEKLEEKREERVKKLSKN